MYFKIKVGLFQLWINQQPRTLSRVEDANKRKEHPDIPHHKRPRSVDVEEVTREISGSECEGRTCTDLHLCSLFLGGLSAEGVP